jgi:hypothetical protein
MTDRPLLWPEHATDSHMSPTTRTVFGASFLVLCCWTPGRAAAQAQKCGPEDKTEWWPDNHKRELRIPLSAADRAVMEPNLKAAEAIARKTAYGTPRGFAVRPYWGYDNPQNRDRLSPYNFGAVVFLTCSRYDEHGADIIIWFNPDPKEWTEGDIAMRDDNGDGLYLEQPRSATRFGSTATFGEFEKENTRGLFVLFTAGGVSPTLPVSREEYLRAMIFTLEGKNGQKVKEAVAMTTKTEYERWIEGAAARKKAHEEMLEGVARVDKSQVAKLRADLEKAERENTETLRKNDAQDRERLNQMKSQASLPGDRLRAQLAAMTPAERALPAFAGAPLEVVPADTPNAVAVIRANPAFYRARSSPFEPRAVLVRMPNPHKEMTAQHQQMFKDFDWAALKRLLDARP